jgi:polyphosphate kinase
MKEIKKEKVNLATFKDIEKDDCKYLETYYKKAIKPLLSPQIIGKKHPFPFLNNKEIYAVAVLKTKNTEKLCIVPCSNSVFQRLIPISSEKHKYILVEDLILHFMADIFEKYVVKSKALIRIIRNADIDIDVDFYNEDLTYRESMENLLKVRKRLCPVKMEYSGTLDEKTIKLLCNELELKNEQVFHSKSPLELSFLYQFRDDLSGNIELFYEKNTPSVPLNITTGISMIDKIAEKDILLSYPYDNMSLFIRLLKEAARDSRVVSIKISLYRVAKNSRVVDALIEAAENGKEVVVMLELRARFDEENNLECSKRMEEAGCRIIYGMDFVKVHSKICLISYSESGLIKHICQIGTGNYNEKTAKLYTDLSIMTADKNISEEVAMTFNKICTEQFVDKCEHLLVAPNFLQNKIIEMIDEQIDMAKAGKQGYIGLKMNSLTDKVIIDKLIEASGAGVKIDMVIRGICCLIAKIPDKTENITVRSIVGRYLEHSRIYIFGNIENEKIYISSADFMTRNMSRRVEVAAPIYNMEIKQKIRNKFNQLMKDNVNAYEMDSNGDYHKIITVGPIVNSQNN